MPRMAARACAIGCTMEKAKAGIALTMIGGSAVAARDSPPAFGKLRLFDERIVTISRRSPLACARTVRPRRDL